MRLAGVSLTAVCTALVVAASAAGSAGGSRALHDSATSAQGRPFNHNRHEQLSCSECHGTGEQHRVMLVRSARDCASCHHDAARGFACSNCHQRDSLPEGRAVTALFNLSVWDATRARVLPFGHMRHAGVTCASCHETPVTMEVTRQCRSCHAQHEQPEANCATCHPGELRGTHDAEAHLSCAGAGCHRASAGLKPTPRRTCVACHAEQREHEPGGNCAACHQVPSLPPDSTHRGGR